MECKDAASCLRCSVGRFVSLLVTTVSPAKTDGSTEMMFGLWTRVGPRKNYVLGGAPDSRRGRNHFGVVPH